MTKITFDIDEDTKTATAHLPEPTLEAPEIDSGSLSYLPEGKSGDMQEVLKLCKEDALDAVKEDGQIKEKALDNLKSTVRALTLPLLGADYTLVFDNEHSTPEKEAANAA